VVGSRAAGRGSGARRTDARAVTATRGRSRQEGMLRQPQLTGRTGQARLRAVATVACLVVAAASSWFALLAAPAIRFIPVTVLVAMPGLLAVGAASRRAAACATVVCVPGAMLVAGVPAASLAPHAWPELLVRFGSAAAQVIAPGSQPGASAWSLAAVMLANGALWMAGGVVVASSVVSSRRLILAFVLLAAPWLAAVCESTPDHAAWLGALVLVAGVLWFSSAPLTITLGVLTALLSVAIAQAVGPHQRWFGLGEDASKDLPFSRLDTEPSYGRLSDRRTGAPMFEVTAAEPALWRMQTLDSFDGSGWTAGPNALPELPQPGARREQTVVRVLGLRQNLVVAPGRVDGVDAQGSVARTGGEAWQLAATPRTGDTYRVVASSVRVSADQLAGDHAPLDPRVRAYTRLGVATQDGIGLSVLGWMFGSLGVSVRALTMPALDPRVIALAQRLAADAPTEWDKVVRVERFLLGGDRFRYTTQLRVSGPQPVVDFLLRTRVGDCEHFAGAAALLLRLAGVPARVVAGFATGRQTGPRQYTIRDLDAHDWIEVYFPGDGWVPFNPTPAASPATIAGGLDLLRPPTRTAGGPGRLPVSALLSVLAVAAGLVLVGWCTRRPSRRPPELFERIASRSAGHVEPSTTLAQLGVMMARIGPRTAALAAETERARFATGPSAAPPRHPRIRLARALVNDVGPLGALLVWAPVPYRVRTWSGVVSPAAEEGEDEQRQQ
jgi:hypothetical protein